MSSVMSELGIQHDSIRSSLARNPCDMVKSRLRLCELQEVLLDMSNICDVCGKGPQFGQNIRHVHSGAWALRAPRTKRRWLPNLQTVRADVKGVTKRMRVCAKCLKAGKVARAV
jgi:large subunit ribosomal protein L28